MAKKRIPRKPKAPNDAINFAALHWYALMIERICIQLYVTDRSNFDLLKHTLTDTLKALNVANKTTATPCGDCQDGWECCADGMCAPTCVNELD
jgi:hypothetical protein